MVSLRNVFARNQRDNVDTNSNLLAYNNSIIINDIGSDNTLNSHAEPTKLVSENYDSEYSISNMGSNVDPTDFLSWDMFSNMTGTKQHLVQGLEPENLEAKDSLPTYLYEQWHKQSPMSEELLTATGVLMTIVGILGTFGNILVVLLILR